jgi:integrase
MSQSIPKYRRKNATGAAFVQHKSIPTSDHRMYLGRYGSAESKKKYQEFLARFLKAPRVKYVAPDDMTVAQLGAAFGEHALVRYQRDGKVTKEGLEVDLALKPLWEHFGNTLASEFGPKTLKALRQKLIDSGTLARKTINARLKKIRRFFKWAESEELVPAGLTAALQTVDALRKGHPGTFESAGVVPVSEDVVRATLPWLSPQVAALVQVQLLCGMRPEEATKIRKCDLRFTDPTWLYLPASHKCSWRETSLIKAIPRAAQAILTPFLDRPDDQYLFSPAEATAWQLERRETHYRATRKTPVYPSELRARAKAKIDRRRRPPKRPKGERYSTDSYRRAIAYGIAKAKKAGVEIPAWFPLQLRHTIATRLSQELGEQAAQRWLGHRDLKTTGIYVEREIKELLEIAKAIDQSAGA